MKKIFIYLLSFIIVFSFIYFSIGSDVPILNALKNLVPAEYKNKLKETIFINRYKKSDSVYIVKSNFPNSFELENSSKIHIYSNLNSVITTKLDIFGYNLNEKINCFNTEFKKNYLLEIENFNKNCQNSFYFQGKINDHNGNQYFYFALNNKIINKSKNLFVLPVSNFFNYSSNIWEINNYSIPPGGHMVFIKNSNGSFPISKKVWWAEHTHDAIRNLSNYFNEFDFVYDYDLVNLDLKSYKNIFFIAHQEYINEELLTKVINFLRNNPNRNILSIGAGNFRRVVNFKFINDKIVQFQYPSMLIDHLKFNLNLQADKKLGYTNCKLENFPSTAKKRHPKSAVSIGLVNSNNLLGGIINPYDSLNSTHYFYDIVCGSVKLPLLTVTDFKSSKFLQINTDNVGIYFNDILKLKDKVLEILK